MLSTQPRDQTDEPGKHPHVTDTPPRISSLESTPERFSIETQQNYELYQQQLQDQQQQMDELSTVKTNSKSFFKKQPWQKTQQNSIGRKSSSESIRSNISTTSSIFSTASKISKLPHVVKASVKGLVAKSASTSRRLTLMSQNNNNNNNNNNNINNLTSSSSAYYQTSSPSSSMVSSSSSFGYRLRKRTPSALGLSGMFSRRRASMDQAVGTMDQIHPQESISYSVLKEESHYAPPPLPNNKEIPTTSSTNGSTLHHHLSKLHLSSSSSSASLSSSSSSTTPNTGQTITSSRIPPSTLPPTTTTTTTTITTNSTPSSPSVTSPVGRLLFGKEVTTLFDSTTTALSSDRNNTQKKKGDTQDDQLSREAKNEDVGPSLDVTPKFLDQAQPFHMFLVTATLTSLRTKLLADCDRTLATSLQHPTPPYPVDDLKNIMQDLRRMSDMVGYQKQPQDVFMALDVKIQDQAPVREITSLMKQVIHDDVCQYYKNHEKAIIIPCKGYKVEGKNKFDIPLTISENSTENDTNLVVEHMDHQANWFRKYFVQQSYTTFCGYDDDDEPILITATYDPTLQLYRVITRIKQGPDRRDTIQDSFLLSAPTFQHHHHHSTTLEEKAQQDQQEQQQQIQQHPLDTSVLDTTWKAVIESSSAMPLLDVPFNRLKKITQDVMESSGLESDILKLDENGLHTRYKFGVLFVKEGQTKEEEWFSNEHDSTALDHFLSIIGQRVPLVGYKGWTGGLDRKTGDSGGYTYVNTWQEEHSIAYHVSTLLPSNQGDKQQIQRKRHIGNDIVCLVFVEGKQPFNPAAIKSQFLHVFIVVHKDEWDGRSIWRVEIASVDSVPNFGPPLPDGGIFYDDSELQSFLLAKLINAEYSALKSPKFAQPLTRAREGILTNIVERGYKLAQDPDIRTVHSSRHSKSPSSSSDRSSRSSKSNPSDNNGHSHRDISPAPSRSSVIKDLSEGIVGIGRRRSTQDSVENRQKARQARRKAKGISGTKQNRSESELLVTPEQGPSDLRTSKSSESVSHRHQQPDSTKSTMKKDGFKQRAQTIFTSFSSKRQPTTTTTTLDSSF